MLGNGRLEALCFDGEKRLAHIRGKLRKKVLFGLSPYLHLILVLIFPSLGLDQPRRHYPFITP